MNIDDIKTSGIVIPGDADVFPRVFEMQRALMERYHPIERRVGACVMPESDTGPWHIDDHKVQARIKDMFWRTTEEIAEAFEGGKTVVARVPAWRNLWGSDAEVRHFMEEVIDALHFFAEASIIGGFDPVEDMRDLWELATADQAHDYKELLVAAGWTGAIYATASDFLFTMGLAANCLKNKPWKQSQMPTDAAKFKRIMRMAWTRFMAFFRWMDCEREDVFRLYFQKHTVNVFRQDTNY